MRFLPDRLRIRFITSSPPVSNPASASFVSIGGGKLSKSASTVASSSLWRMISAPPRSPETSPSAPRMIDLPAPVSPVMMFSPGPSSRTTSSITAKFLMRSSRSIGSSLSLAPLELFAQDFVVTARRQFDQRNRQTVVACFDFVAVIQAHALLAVGAENDRVAEGAQGDVNRRVARHNNRSEEHTSE